MVDKGFTITDSGAPAFTKRMQQHAVTIVSSAKKEIMLFTNRQDGGDAQRVMDFSEMN